MYSAQEISKDELAWCANVNRIKALSWHDGNLFCYETRLLEKWKELLVTDVCIARGPYQRTIEVRAEGMPTTFIPVTRASACEIEILRKGLQLLNKSEEDTR